MNSAENFFGRSYLSVGLRMGSGNRHIARDSSENTFYITSTGNVFDAR